MLEVTTKEGKKITIPDSERTRCEVWSRVMGYHRPVIYWNKGKQQEHADRKHFIEPKECGAVCA